MEMPALKYSELRAGGVGEFVIIALASGGLSNFSRSRISNVAIDRRAPVWRCKHYQAQQAAVMPFSRCPSSILLGCIVTDCKQDVRD